MDRKICLILASCAALLGLLGMLLAFSAASAQAGTTMITDIVVDTLEDELNSDDDGERWRIALESVEDGERRGFDDLDALFAYLRQAVGRPQWTDRSHTGGETGMSLDEDGRLN